MQAGVPSRTALAAAVHRAVHQELEGGSILRDPLAIPILGDEARSVLDEARRDASLRGLRVFVALRSRFAEDALARSLDKGMRQLTILGAGLDTFAYRSPLAAKLRIFEVDHPATQSWKRERLIHAGIYAPPTLTFVPADLEVEDLAGVLQAAGFDTEQPSFFMWLGVVPYLSASAVFSTLSYISALRAGAQVVFDYANPLDPAQEDPQHFALRAALEERVASYGERLRSYFETSALHARLSALGFDEIEDLGPAAIRQRYFGQRPVSSSDRGAHILRAGRLLRA